METAVPFVQHNTTLNLMTDASDFGWSGVLLPFQVNGVWSPWERSNSINWRELREILDSVILFRNSLRGHSIRVLSDNKVALSCIYNQGFLHTPALYDLSRELLLFAATEYFFGPCSHQGCIECPCGKRFKGKSDRNKVVLRSRILQLDLLILQFMPTSGPLCYQGELSTFFFCFSMPGPRNDLLGCNVPELECIEMHIPFSSKKFPQLSVNKTFGFSRNRDSYCPLLGVPELVSSSSYEDLGRSSSLQSLFSLPDSLSWDLLPNRTMESLGVVSGYSNIQGYIDRYSISSSFIYEGEVPLHRLVNSINPCREEAWALALVKKGLILMLLI